ncbi:MAG TPA: hypothetical protein VE912_02305 [Bacteroidales bacterium]|nr:hypothetical protein [Bacteroidales bacterium]
MKIVRIIPENDCLLSVYDDENGKSKFRQLFDNWYDIEYLFDFFVTNQNDLITDIDSAIQITIDGAEKLEDKLLEISDDESEQLQTIFRPLSPSEYRLSTYQKSKAYGTFSRSWLRIYAIRIDPDLYVVTGGAIKLTQKMQGRSHTQEQLNLLNQARDYLREIGFTKNDLEDLETEL